MNRDRDGGALQGRGGESLRFLIRANHRRGKQIPQGEIYPIGHAIGCGNTDLRHDLVDVLGFDCDSSAPVKRYRDLRDAAGCLGRNRLSRVFHISVLHDHLQLGRPPAES